MINNITRLRPDIHFSLPCFVSYDFSVLLFMFMSKGSNLTTQINILSVRLCGRLGGQNWERIVDWSIDNNFSAPRDPEKYELFQPDTEQPVDQRYKKTCKPSILSMTV